VLDLPVEHGDGLDLAGITKMGAARGAILTAEYLVASGHIR
jgi:hypothetical protein